MNNGNNMPSQSPRDRVMWILANRSGKMEWKDLRRYMRMRYADIDPILAELEKESWINRLPSQTDKEIIILRTDRQNNASNKQGLRAGGIRKRSFRST